MDVRQSLLACDIFAVLPEAVLEELAANSALILLPGREMLFDAGSPAGPVYVVARGRLRVFRAGAGGSPDLHLGDVRSGEIVGEISVFGGVPHTARVIAVRDTALVRVPSGLLLALLERHPQAWPHLTRTIIARLVSGNFPHPREITTLCVRPLGGVDASGLALGLREAMPSHLRCAHLRPSDGAGLNESELMSLCDRAEDENDLVLFEAAGEDPDVPGRHGAWNLACLRHADTLVDVVDPLRPRAPMTNLPGSDWQARELLRLVDGGRAGPGAGVPAAGYRAIHHAAPDRGPDLRRLARLILGRGHGLVLSGGAPKGTAHIGVALALRDAGLEIDFVAGTSAGALVGAMVADRWSAQDMREAVYRLAAFPAWRELQPPFAAILSGRLLRRLLQDFFGSRAVEETWLPFEPIAADLLSGETVVPRGIPLWQAVQASMALPGLWPPVASGAHLLIDGGTVNNLPVDRALSPCGRGTITASDVSTGFHVVSRPGSDLPTGWDTLRGWVGGRRMQAPGLVDVLTRAGSLASAAMGARTASAVTRLITPDVDPPAGLSASARVDWLIESGYAAGRRALESEGG